MHQHHHQAGRRESCIYACWVTGQELTVSTPGMRANPEPPDGGEEGVEPPHQGRQEWLTACARTGEIEERVLERR
jgi:hypothetical protein